jgi:hypothetical protein
MVVMAAPGENAIEISMAQNRYLVDRDTTLTQPQRDSVLRAARASLDPARQTIPWVKFWMSYDPAPLLRQVTAPTLVLQGATDRQVPADQAEKFATLVRAGGNRDVVVRVFPDVNHLFVADASGDFLAYDQLRSNRIDSGVLGVLADWLVERLDATIDPAGRLNREANRARGGGAGPAPEATKASTSPPLRPQPFRTTSRSRPPLAHLAPEPRLLGEHRRASFSRGMTFPTIAPALPDGGAASSSPRRP